MYLFFINVDGYRVLMMLSIFAKLNFISRKVLELNLYLTEYILRLDKYHQERFKVKRKYMLKLESVQSMSVK